jgi:hypothetical protein
MPIISFCICSVFFFSILSPLVISLAYSTPKEAALVNPSEGINHSTSSSTTIITGSYYLRSIDLSGRADIGSLLKNNSNTEEVTCCSDFVLFPFSENGTYTELYNISLIYFHCWVKARSFPGGLVPGHIHRFGYSTSRAFGDSMNESIIVDSKQNKSMVDYFSLICPVQHTNTSIASFNGSDIFNFTIKDRAAWPYIITSPHQESFILLFFGNTEPGHLGSLDSDGDGLADSDELYKYYTNPYDNDTDHDNATDYEEVSAATHGYQNSDPNNYTDTTEYRRLVVNAGGPYAGISNKELAFTGTATGCFPPYNWSWQFGDGNHSYEQNPRHTYTTPGNYTVTLTVSDNGSIPYIARNTTFTVIREPTRSVQIKNKGGKNITTTFTNTGETNIIDMAYTITVNGGMFGFINKNISGRLSILREHTSFSLEIPQIIGFGKITVIETIHADEMTPVSQTAHGFIFLFYTMNIK